jgi:hypothetical protein
VTVCIDLHLHAAVAEDPLRDYRDHVYTLHGGRDNEGRRFVIGVGSAGADCGDEVFRTGDNSAIPIAVAIKEGNHRISTCHGAIEHYMRIDSDQRPIVVRVAIAGAGSSRIDVTQYRAGVATDRIRFVGGFRHLNRWIFDRPNFVESLPSSCIKLHSLLDIILKSHSRDLFQALDLDMLGYSAHAL